MPDQHPAAPNRLAIRQMALRAIMDGRGVDAVILSSPRSLAHYGGIEAGERQPRLLVVTARAALPVGPEGATDIWAAAAALLPPGCALGHEGDASAEALRMVAHVAQPRRLLSISAEVARQIAQG